MLAGLAVGAFGNGFTVTLAVAVAEQLLAPFTVTLYVAFEVGATVRLAAVLLSSHVYVLPPLAVRVVLLPLQILVVEGLMLALGKAFTVIFPVRELGAEQGDTAAMLTV